MTQGYQITLKYKQYELIQGDFKSTSMVTSYLVGFTEPNYGIG